MVNRSNKVSPRGFTLMELMVVVGVIALVTAATLPSFSRALLQNRQREATSLITKAVLTARSSAPRSGRCFRLIVSTSNPRIHGGNGGSVRVDQYIRVTSDCGEPAADTDTAAWIPISFHSIGGATDQAMLVGQDIAISRVLDNTCQKVIANDIMYFNPDGSLYFSAAVTPLDRLYEINMFTTYDTNKTGISRYVRLAANGSVRLATCP
jgi:prepilin-type N-terminal cleavage/methylation domain-containing protein